MKENKISTGTITRTVCLAVALLNQVLTVIGKSPLPIADETVSVLISTVVTVIAAGVSWWKNNSFTEKAIEADKVLHKESEEN